MSDGRPFADLLREHRNGMTHDELSDALRDLVAKVSDENKGGKLTIVISVKPIGKGDGLEVGFEHKLALPKETPGTAVFFATPDNALVRQDPRQTAMELREIGPAAAHRGVA